MTRECRHIKEYETETLRSREKGLTLKEIRELLGFTHKQLKNFIIRHNANQRKKAVGIALK